MGEFLTEYLHQVPPPIQCNVRGRDFRCQNKAAFVLEVTDHEDEFVCNLCLPNWVPILVRRFGAVMVKEL